MTTHTVSATPSSTSRTPSAPKNSRPGERWARHSPGLSRTWQGGSVGEQLATSRWLPKCWGTVCLWDSVSVGCWVGVRLSWAMPVSPLQTLLLLLAVQRAGCLLPRAVGVWAPQPALHCRLQEEDHPAGGDGCCEVGARPAARVGPARGTPGCHTGVFSGTGMTHGSSR